MRKALDAFLLLASSTLAVRVNTYCVASHIPVLASIVTSAVGALIFYKIAAHLVLILPLRHRICRRVLDPVAMLEGYWIATDMDIPDRPFSFATIQYNVHSGEYQYSGVAFTPHFGIGATWSSDRVQVDLSRDQLLVFFEGQLRDAGAEVVRGYGVIDLEKNSNGSYTRAKGFFVDSGTKFLKSHFLLDRIYPAQIRALIGSSDIRSNDEMERLVRAYMGQHGSAS